LDAFKKSCVALNRLSRKERYRKKNKENLKVHKATPRGKYKQGVKILNNEYFADTYPVQTIDTSWSNRKQMYQFLKKEGYIFVRYGKWKNLGYWSSGL